MKYISQIFIEGIIDDPYVAPLDTSNPLKDKNAGVEGYIAAKNMAKDNKWRKNQCNDLEDEEEKRKCHIVYNDILTNNYESILNDKCSFSRTPQRCFNAIMNKMQNAQSKRDNGVTQELNSSNPK